MDRLLTPLAAAELLGVSEGALAQWRFRHVGPDFLKLNERAVRYSTSDLQAWLDGRVISADQR